MGFSDGEDIVKFNGGLRAARPTVHNRNTDILAGAEKKIYNMINYIFLPGNNR